MHRLLPRIVFVSILMVHADAQAPVVGDAPVSASFLSHDGSTFQLDSSPLVADVTSGDFSVGVSLTFPEPQPGRVLRVRHAWCYLQGDSVFQFPDGAAYFSSTEATQKVDAAGEVCKVTVAPSYGYDSEAFIPRPGLPAGSWVLRTYIGGEDMATDGSVVPIGHWGFVDLSFSVISSNFGGYRMYVFQHRRLVCGAPATVCLERGTSDGDEVMGLGIDLGDGELATEMAMFLDGETRTTFSVTPRAMGTLHLFGKTEYGELIPSPYLFAKPQDEFPAPCPPHSEGTSGASYECSFQGGAETGISPKKFTGPCVAPVPAVDPAPPPECVGLPAQVFVQNGRCRQCNHHNFTCCEWSAVPVMSGQYTVTVTTVDCHDWWYGPGRRTECEWRLIPNTPRAATTYNRCLTKVKMIGNCGITQ